MPQISITAILGNSQSLDGGAMFGNAPRVVWEKWIKPDSLGRIPLSCRAMLVEVNDKKILCETGIGAFFDPKLASRYGVNESQHILLQSLNNIGLTDKDIDFVVLSHLHFDHAGGLLPSWEDQKKGHQDLLFPNAKYVVSATSFERSESPHPRDKASFIPDLADKLKKSGRMIIVNSATHPDVLPEFISFTFTDGHTPGHMHTIVKGQNSKIIFAGDLIPGRSWVHLPITMGYDRYAELVIDEKSKIYAEFSGEKNWFFYTHDHETAMSHIVKEPSGKYVALGNIDQPVRYSI
jgi:glyoxylase-like metal-dependent hydrolase (beta-lactamase superfamily II)